MPGFPELFFYFASKCFWKKRSRHQGMKEVACIVSKPLVSCLWCYVESVNSPKLNIQEVQGALSSRPSWILQNPSVHFWKCPYLQNGPCIFVDLSYSALVACTSCQVVILPHLKRWKYQFPTVLNFSQKVPLRGFCRIWVKGATFLYLVPPPRPLFASLLCPTMMAQKQQSELHTWNLKIDVIQDRLTFIESKHDNTMSWKTSF